MNKICLRCGALRMTGVKSGLKRSRHSFGRVVKAPGRYRPDETDGISVFALSQENSPYTRHTG